VVTKEVFFLLFSSLTTTKKSRMCTTVTTQNIYAYYKVLKILITLSTLTILVFQDVSLVSGFEVFIPANQQNNNAVETLNFAFAAFPI
jgi:hypothetical protein